MIETVLHRFDLPPATGVEFQSFRGFRGPTPAVGEMECHASVLAPGASPHAPHVHAEEEVLVPLDGDVELRIASAPDDPSPRCERIGRGSFVYYPAGQHHTIRNPGGAPVAYLMFKWTAPPSNAAVPHGTAIVHYAAAEVPERAGGFGTRRVFDAPTSMLARLHAHVSRLEPGAGYEPHADPYDVAVVLLSGEVETLGRRLEPSSVAYFAAGAPHGMRNPGPAAARYLVFEFHAPPGVLRRVHRSLRGAAGRVLRGVRRVVGRIAGRAGRARRGDAPRRAPLR